MDKKPVRRWGLWLLAAGALFVAGCLALTTDAVIEYLPEPMAAWIRTETLLWHGSTWGEWLGREWAVWRTIFGG